MEVDLELYRREVRVASQPPTWLSVIDVSPDQPLHTLVFLHGFGGQATQWQYQLERFSRASRVVAPDLPGHGRSSPLRGSYRMDRILSVLDSGLSGLGINDKIVLVGHSFGGAVAAEFAAAYPSRVKSLVLVATAGEFHLNPFYRLLLRLPAPILRMFAPAVRGWLGAPPTVLKAWYQQSVARWSGWNLFRLLALPTLVIRGHQDQVFARPMFEEVARAIPNADEVDVGASGHLVMLERHEAVNRTLARFLEAGKRAWREGENGNQDPERNALVKERPWLSHYDEGVPYTIAIPRVPLHTLLVSAARRFPNRAALIYAGQRLSYRKLNEASDRFANALRALGVEPGERVMLVLPNLPQLIICFYGALKASAVVVFSLPATAPAELARQLRETEARVLITLPEYQGFLQQLTGETGPSRLALQHLLLTRPGEDFSPFTEALPPALPNVTTHVLQTLLDAQPSISPDLVTDAKELAVILYTGGTTAAPRGVMLSHRNLVANALQTRYWMPKAQAGQEIFLGVLPLAHSYGLTAALNVPMTLGATLILRDHFEPSGTLQAIQAYRPTIFPGVPQMYVALADFPGVRKYGIQSIKACISGAAPLPLEVQESFEKLTRGRLVEGYGLTEASPVTHANPLGGLRKAGSIGIPLPSTEAQILDLKKGEKPVPEGHIGELAVRGPQVMLGYWNDERATRRVLSRDGWLLTGDVAQVDGEGYFRIIARKSEMWYPTKPGLPAFPRDIEEVLYEIPQVKEAAVVAIARQPIAFLIARQERPSTEAVLAYAKRRLPPELVPRLVIFVEDFPRSFIGKVLRRELAKRVRDQESGI